MEIVIKPLPELTDKYPAVEGIAKSAGIPTEEHPCVHLAQNPIRSDVLEILKLQDGIFDEWYARRKEATERELADYRLFASIPHLGYGAEEQKLDMCAYSHVKSHLQSLEEGLEFLEVIKLARSKLRVDQY